MKVRRNGIARAALCTMGLLAACLTGCQVDVAGQTLPSPNYMLDDVQYFAPGPEFKLSREAAANEAFKNEQELDRGFGP